MPSDDAEKEPPVLKSDRAPILVRDVFEAKGYRELEEDEEEVAPINTAAVPSPSSAPIWHVYWKGGRFKPSEYTTANPLQRVNHFPKTMGITKKDCLLRNLRRMRSTHGAIFSFFPESYILPSEYMTLVRVCEQHPPGQEKPIWILKPTDSSQGRKIFIIRDLAEISYGHFSESMANAIANDGATRDLDPDRDPKLDEKGRAISTELDMSTTLRMLKSRLHKTVTPCVKFTEMHIAQRYLERPLCFCGYKLDLRVYVLLLSAQPLRLYWFNDCLLRFATQKYDLADLDNTYAHLTNTSINKYSTSYSTVKEGIRGGCKWSLLQFIREYPDHPLGSPLLWARIKAIVNLTLLSIAAGIPDNGGCFELFGYDIMVDDALRPWLLEVNCSPALGVECAADREVKEPLISDLVDLLDQQRGHASAAMPAGGGARAAKARGWPSQGEGVRRRSGGSDAAEAPPPPKRGGRTAAAEIAANAPANIGGYELIFPFNSATTRLANNVGGNEAQIVSEVRAELQRANERSRPGDEPEDGSSSSGGGESREQSREGHGNGGGAPEYGANYAERPGPGRAPGGANRGRPTGARGAEREGAAPTAPRSSNSSHRAAAPAGDGGGSGRSSSGSGPRGLPSSVRNAPPGRGGSLRRPSGIMGPGAPAAARGFSRALGFSQTR